MTARGWWTAARHRIAKRALERQLDYQKRVARGHLQPAPDAVDRKAEAADELLMYVTLPAHPRMLEVGTAGKGLLFHLPPAGLRVGVDPLAVAYRFIFPPRAQRVRGCAAIGEELPFSDGAFDLVVCDNVIDHAERPGRILRELVRVLRPEGTLYFTVNVHHPIYFYAALAHRLWNALGIRFEIGPFADHTVHFTIGQVRRMVSALPLTRHVERDEIAAARRRARASAPRHLGDRLKRFFFKNARYVLIAGRRDQC